VGVKSAFITAILVGTSIFLAPNIRAETALGVTVIGSSADPRADAVEEAVAFWNRELSRLGVDVRFGKVRFTDGEAADRLLNELERGKLDLRSDDGLPELLRPIPGDVVVALPDAKLTSFGTPWSPKSKGFVALRRADTAPLSLPNVARNAAAHELGHVLGLDHNDDATTLMCGRPAPCRPDAFASDTPRFFPLKAEEERRLRSLWSR
jgi:hypothetical protein